MSDSDYDAVLVLSFGGPERPEDVLPFLENVLRGKNVPRERMLDVAAHYDELGGASPINDQNRRLIAALREELTRCGIELPVFFGNRNWHPMLADALRDMADHGIERVLAYVTSAYSSYSGCRQYLEDIERARKEVGPRAPRVDKLRAFYNRPGFIEAQRARVDEALELLPESRRAAARWFFTAHSIPLSMAEGCDYECQLREACRLVCGDRPPRQWHLAYQSRSGPPSQPWLEPDIGDLLRAEHQRRPIQDAIVVPIGFLSDHVEVLFDLDVEARAVADQLGIHLVRASTVGTHPRFVAMIRELIDERIDVGSPRQTLGDRPALPDVCPADCCPSGRRG